LNFAYFYVSIGDSYMHGYGIHFGHGIQKPHKYACVFIHVESLHTASSRGDSEAPPKPARPNKVHVSHDERGRVYNNVTRVSSGSADNQT